MASTLICTMATRRDGQPSGHDETTTTGSQISGGTVFSFHLSADSAANIIIRGSCSHISTPSLTHSMSMTTNWAVFVGPRGAALDGLVDESARGREDPILWFSPRDI